MSAGSFTVDWSITRGYWSQMFVHEQLTGRPGLRFLEVGAFEGMASRWLLEHVLTDPTSSLTVIDTFEGSAEHSPMGVDVVNLEARFRANLAGFEDQLDVWVGTSSEFLWALRRPGRPPRFDFVYLDGSHRSRDVLEDAVLAWPLLKVQGLLCFDDLSWQAPGSSRPDLDSPRMGIEAFLACYQAEAVPVYVDEAAGAQLVLRKRDPAVDALLGIK